MVDLLIYTPVTTPRIEYIFNHIFYEHFGVEYAVTNNIGEYKATSSCYKFSYANENIDASSPFFFASSLLTEDDIHKVNLNAGKLDEIPVLFQHGEKNSSLSFDVFAATFYLLSRYEEYIEPDKDIYGNFDLKQSILYKWNYLHIPVVEQWLELLLKALLNHFPNFAVKKQKARFAMSIDVDVAYAYLHKSVFITLGSFFKKVGKLQLSRLKEQLLTLQNKREDLYDTYDYIFDTVKDWKTLFFFNMGSYGKFDKNPSYKNEAFRQLIKWLDKKATVGLHPSYTSNKHKNILKEEKRKFQTIISHSVTISRQHYLKLQIPETYQTLIEAGITKDFTMGYYFDYGFRAGTCNPFLFFDLSKKRVSNLTIYPFIYMDGTLKNVFKSDIEEAKKVVTKLAETVLQYKGIFIPVWHNSTLCNNEGWEGWREVFEHTICEAGEKGFESLNGI